MTNKQLEFNEGKNYSVDITGHTNGFSISYHEIDYFGFKLDKSEISKMLNRISKVIAELGICASEVIIQFVPDELQEASCSVGNGNIIHLVIPVCRLEGQATIPSRGVSDDYLIYHELMHARDILEGRFPTSGLIDMNGDIKKVLRSLAWDFSIDGRLEKEGRPHRSRAEYVKLHSTRFVENYEGKPARVKRFFEDLGQALWGKEISAAQADAAVKKYWKQNENVSHSC